jgi:flagellar motor switch protein FliG
MRKLSGKLRKAAILIASLDEASTDILLERIPAEKGAKVRRAIVELETIEGLEQQGVLREFLLLSGSPLTELSVSNDEGVELAPELKQKIDHPLPSHHVLPSANGNQRESNQSTPAPGRFRFLQQASAEDLARMLNSEHPQVSAVVLAHVPPEKSAQVLRHFKTETQVDILRRIADSHHVDHDVLHELEQQLERRFAPHADAPPELPGLRTVQAILAAARDRENLDLLGKLEQVDKQLLERAGLVTASTSNEKNTSDAASPRPGTLAEGGIPPLRTRSDDHPRGPSAIGIFPVKMEDVRPEEGNSSAAEQRSGWARWSQRKRSRAAELGLSLYVEPEDEVQAPMKPRRAGAVQDVAGRTRHWQFFDITRLDKDELARLIQAAAPPTLLAALAGAEPAFIARIMGQLPSADARRLQQHLRQLGSLEQGEIERAQQQMSQLASALCARGLLRAPLRGKLAPAA